LIDFSDPENAISVNPTGQSGNVMSRHYDDQCELFNNGQFRKQMMNREEIERTSHRRLRLIPSAG
jgi:penicillin amidase